jgi:hypothetical protein
VIPVGPPVRPRCQEDDKALGAITLNGASEVILICPVCDFGPGRAGTPRMEGARDWRPDMATFVPRFQ